MKKPINFTQNQDIGTALLSLYQCLTHPDYFEEMTSFFGEWLSSDDTVFISQIEQHSDQVWDILRQHLEDEKTRLRQSWDIETAQFAHAAALQENLYTNLPPEDQLRLKTWCANSKSTPQSELPTLVFRSYGSDDESPDLGLVRLTDSGEYSVEMVSRHFPSAVSEFFSQSFSLTPAESMIIQHLVLGRNLRTISEILGKSIETLRTQLKSLTGKLGVTSQAEVKKLFIQSEVLKARQHHPVIRVNGSATVRQLRLRDGRKLEYEVDGDRNTKTLLFLHSFLEGRHWPKKCVTMATKRGWRVLRVSRSGSGNSVPTKLTGTDLLQSLVQDYVELLRAENLSQVAVFAKSSAFSIAYAFALAHPNLVSRLIGIDIMPPVPTRAAMVGFKPLTKTYAMAAMYAPSVVKVMVGLGLKFQERNAGTPNAEKVVIPGFVEREFEDEDGRAAEVANFYDLAQNGGEQVWRETSFTTLNWADAPEKANNRPLTSLIVSKNCQFFEPGSIQAFAQRLNAEVHSVPDWQPFMTSCLPKALDILDTPFGQQVSQPKL